MLCCWRSVLRLFRTVGTAVGRRTKRAVVVTVLATAVRSANTVTGKHIISLVNRTSRQLIRRRQPRHHETASPPIMAVPHEPPQSRGPVAERRPRAAPLPPPSPNRQLSTSARRRQRLSVRTAPARRHQPRPSPSQHLVQKRRPKLPLSYNIVEPPGD